MWIIYNQNINTLITNCRYWFEIPNKQSNITKLNIFMMKNIQLTIKLKQYFNKMYCFPVNWKYSFFQKITIEVLIACVHRGGGGSSHPFTVLIVISFIFCCNKDFHWVISPSCASNTFDWDDLYVLDYVEMERLCCCCCSLFPSPYWRPRFVGGECNCC